MRIRTWRLVLLAALLGGAAGAAVFLYLRRPSPSTGGGATQRVIFVGLDGADWEQLDAMMARGVMPALSRLVREGQSGSLRTIHPPLSPIVWTSMMTGASPLEHGILDFVRVNPSTRQPEPITSDERRLPAIWNMASQRGRKACVLGLWATYPAEQVNGMIVTDRAWSFMRSGVMPAGAVAPAEQGGGVGALVEEARREVDETRLREILPWLTDADIREAAAVREPYSQPVSALRRMLIEAAAVTQIARAAIDRDRPDLTIAYYQGTDVAGHVFAPYAPPKQDGIDPVLFDRYSRVRELYFAEIDRVIDSYRQMAESTRAVLVVASDHGFAWGTHRPRTVSSTLAATAAKWHTEQGIYLLWGEGVRAAVGARPRGDAVQVCPTLLAFLGLPRAKGMAAAPLPGAPPLSGEYDYAAGYHPATPMAVQGEEAAQQLESLRALGYIEASVAAQGGSSTRTAASWNNEGLLRRQRGEWEGARQAFERALEIDPRSTSAAWNLSDLLATVSGEWQRAESLLWQAVDNGLSEPERRLTARALQHKQAGRTRECLATLDRAIARFPHDHDLTLLRGRMRLEAQDCSGALADFTAATKADLSDPLAQASLGVAWLCLGDTARASVAFRRSLELDPNQPQIRAQLAAIESR